MTMGFSWAEQGRGNAASTATNQACLVNVRFIDFRISEIRVGGRGSLVRRHPLGRVHFAEGFQVSLNPFE